ncbi:MAG: DUF1501 domain-containing protein [Xanthomonadales bacterium]|nr:DUF1501 domain-containing protein [Xanthomonadales bacterium]
MDKKTVNLPRRRFFADTGAGIAAGAASVGLGFSNRVTAGNGPNIQTKLLVYVFLRGGMDGLSFMVPTSGPDQSAYAQARDRTYIAPTDGVLDLFGSGFGLNPNCSALHNIRNRVAFIHACGHPENALTRSHFDAQEQIELGTPGDQTGSEGFLARYLSNISHDPTSVFTSMASSSNTPVSLGGYTDVATLDSPSSFSPNSSFPYADTHNIMLREMYNGAGTLDEAGLATMDAVDFINSFDLGNYQSANSSFPYPDSGFANDLALIAQLWTLNLGISVATVDRGGWDNHTDMNPLPNNFGFGARIGDISSSLRAFYEDLAARGRANDVAIVVQTEFGRQVSENGNFGTDHGYGCPMLVIGGGINGGVYGSFPGIQTQQRIGDSVRPTTDFRRVHSSVIDRVMGRPDLVNDVFPGFPYTPMNFTL